MSALRPDCEQVEFPSHGVKLRGRLYHGSDEARSPVVVMAPGFSATVSEMAADRYAEAFADAGLRVLLFDNPSFGASDGEPRHEIEPWAQSRGYLAAVAYMRSRDDVDPGRIDWTAGHTLAWVDHQPVPMTATRTLTCHRGAGAGTRRRARPPGGSNP